MPYRCYTLVCSGFHRRSTQIPGWVFTNIWETLFTLLPWSAIAHSTVSPFAREGHNGIGNQSPWSGSSDPFHRPAHSVAACFLRLPPFRGCCSSAKLSAGSLFIAWCSPVIACFLRLPYVKRRLGVTVLQVQCLFFILLVSSFVPFRRYAPSSRYCSHQAWDLKRGCFFLCRIPYAVPCCFDPLFTHCVTNVTHSLGLGLRVFCPVLPVSLPSSRGSVPTLFDSTIHFHSNLFKVRRSSNHLGFRGGLFPLGRAYKYAACIFCNTWFQIPCWQIVHVHIYHHGKIKFPNVITIL